MDLQSALLNSGVASQADVDRLAAQEKAKKDEEQRELEAERAHEKAEDERYARENVSMLDLFAGDPPKWRKVTDVPEKYLRDTTNITQTLGGLMLSPYNDITVSTFIKAIRTVLPKDVGDIYWRLVKEVEDSPAKAEKRLAEAWARLRNSENILVGHLLLFSMVASVVKTMADVPSSKFFDEKNAVPKNEWVWKSMFARQAFSQKRHASWKQCYELLHPLKDVDTFNKASDGTASLFLKHLATAAKMAYQEVGNADEKAGEAKPAQGPQGEAQAEVHCR